MLNKLLSIFSSDILSTPIINEYAMPGKKEWNLDADWVDLLL